MKKPTVALIGCGSISRAYLENARTLYSDDFQITAVSDIVMERALAMADKFAIDKALTTEEVMQDPDIDMVLNLTIPMAHTEITLRALRAGKHVYTEKPLTITREEAQIVLNTAKEVKKYVGCAPDTFLGMPLQTALKAIHDGQIGIPFGANCMCIHPTHGNENCHPDPEFYYKKGAGPMFDMAAYYINQLVAVFGPVASVSCYQTKNFEERVITTQPHRGKKIQVEVPTHVLSMMQFECGAIVSFMNTLDVWNSKQPWIEIYGTEGTLVLPDPNRFIGDVMLSRLSYGEDKWQPVQPLEEYRNTQRGAGIKDMFEAIREGKAIRVNGEMGAHVVDIVNAFNESAESGKSVMIQTSCMKPQPRFLA
ncbi:MAG: Gfo/Idh/MocA family oxidoreductase [Clostridiales bacterium]|nr:Gfo/Idh/MocA family oxidoreductase [Clostridiales bacterium]